jgi:ketosteroid isomerase-like protein
VAAGLTAAFSVGDLDQWAPLLAPDVRWGGDEETEQTCHSRAQVVGWYQRLRAQGVQVQVLGTQIRGDTVVLLMAVQWPEGWDDEDHRRSTTAQVFRVRDGLVVDIRDDVEDDRPVADSAS